MFIKNAAHIAKHPAIANGHASGVVSLVLGTESTNAVASSGISTNATPEAVATALSTIVVVAGEVVLDALDDDVLDALEVDDEGVLGVEGLLGVGTGITGAFK